MASTTDVKAEITQNGVKSPNGALAKSSKDTVGLKALPKGKYTLVGIDIDTTGRRLIDEVSKIIHDL